MELDAAQLLRELQRVETELEAHGDAVEASDDATRGLSTRTKVLGGALAATAIVVAAGVKAALAHGDALGKMSVRTGWAVESLSGLSRMAKKSDTDLTKLGKGIETLSKGMYDAATKGTGPAAEALDDLGISATAANGELRSSEDVFREVSDALAGLENHTLRTTYAQKLFGGAGRELLPMLVQGSEAMDKEAQAARDLGLVWSEDTTAAAEEFHDALEDLKSIGDGFFGTAAQVYIPILADIAVGAVLAAEAVLLLGNTQRDSDEAQRREAQRLIQTQAEKVSAIRSLIEAEEENIKWAEESGVSAEGFRINIARLNIELEAARGVSRRLSGELGAQAGILLETARALGEDSEARTVSTEATEDQTEAIEAQTAAMAENVEVARESAEEAVQVAKERHEQELAAEEQFQEQIDQIRLAEHHAELARIAAEEEARAEQRQAIESIVRRGAGVEMDIMSVVASAASRNLEEGTKQQQDAELAAFITGKAAAIQKTVVNTILGASNAFGNAPNPIVGAVLAAVAIAAGVVNTIAVAAVPPPRFHDGGLVDEIDIRARAGEAVITPAAVRSVGGAAGVDALNSGTAGPQTLTIVNRIGHRTFDVMTHRAVARTGSPLNRALAATQPRGTARRNPYRARI